MAIEIDNIYQKEDDKNKTYFENEKNKKENVLLKRIQKDEIERLLKQKDDYIKEIEGLKFEEIKNFEKVE